MKKPREATLGLDLSWTRTGWAVWNGRKVLGWGDISTNSNQGCEEYRLHMIVTRILEAVREYKPVMAMIEDLALSRVSTIAKPAGLMWVVRHRLYEQEVLFDLMSPTALKLKATGSGKASKEDMVSAALPFLRECPNDDVADAIHLARCAHEKLSTLRAS